MNKGGFINVALMFLTAAVAGYSTYYVMTTEMSNLITQEVQSKTEKHTVLQSVLCEGGEPFITSVSPASGTVNMGVELNGCNLITPEASTTVYMKNQNDEMGILPIEEGSDGDRILVTIPEKMCVIDSAGICGDDVLITSGDYSLSVDEGGVKSNEVSFIVY